METLVSPPHALEVERLILRCGDEVHALRVKRCLDRASDPYGEIT